MMETPGWALSVALHRNRHRIAEPGLTSEPCGLCQQEASALLGALPRDWSLVDVEAWRKDMGSRSMAAKSYQRGLVDGAAQELERVKGLLV